MEKDWLGLLISVSKIKAKSGERLDYGFDGGRRTLEAGQR